MYYVSIHVELELGIVNKFTKSPFYSTILSVMYRSSNLILRDLPTNICYAVVFIPLKFCTYCILDIWKLLPAKHAFLVGKATCLKGGCKQP